VAWKSTDLLRHSAGGADRFPATWGDHPYVAPPSPSTPDPGKNVSEERSTSDVVKRMASALLAVLALSARDVNPDSRIDRPPVATTHPVRPGSAVSVGASSTVHRPNRAHATASGSDGSPVHQAPPALAKAAVKPPPRVSHSARAMTATPILEPAPDLEAPLVRRADPAEGVEDGLLFSELTVGEAIAILNAHNQTQLVVQDPSILRQRIGGALKVDAPEQFTFRLQSFLGLRLSRTGDSLVLEPIQPGSRSATAAPALSSGPSQNAELEEPRQP
jgi:hypothetical protein